MAFYVGQSVEVASKQEGFAGSYFPATIIAEQHDGSYVVKYKTLLEADESEPLVEKVNSEEVRPRPISIPATPFALNEYVDAFDNDGWWVGRIVRRIKGGYTVYFDISMVAVDYPFEKLRTHLEWCYDEWWYVHPSTAFLPEPAHLSGKRPSSIVYDQSELETKRRRLSVDFWASQC